MWSWPGWGSPAVPGVHIKFVKINNDATTCFDIWNNSVVVKGGEMSIKQCISTNMPELLNRFMETCNIEIEPKANRIHRLVILRFVYSFGKSISFEKCIANLQEAGVSVGTFDDVGAKVRDSGRSL